jgi:hypothetical protein
MRKISKIRDVLRLKFEVGVAQRQIAGSCGLGKTTVAECLARFERSGLSWPAASQLDEATLERTLSPRRRSCPRRRARCRFGLRSTVSCAARA